MTPQKFQHLYPHLHLKLHLYSLVLHLKFNWQLKTKETTKKKWMTPPLKKVSCSSFVNVRYGPKFIELYYINIIIFQKSVMRPKDSKFSLNYQMSQNFLKRPPQLPPPLKNRRMFSQKFQHLYPHLQPNLHLSSLVLHLNFNWQLKRKETTKKKWMTPPLKKVSCSSFVNVRYGPKFIELYYINIIIFQKSVMRPKDSKFSLNYQMSQNFLKRPPQLPPPLKNRRMFSQKFQHLYPHLHPNLHLSSLVLHLNFNRQLKRKETTKKNWMTPPLKKVSCSSFNL